MREVSVLLGFLALSLGVRAQRVEEFKTPPMEMRTKTLWYWNNATVTPEGIDEQLQALRDQAGFGGVGILPYEKHFLPTYLSEEYFNVYEHAARRAKELGMTLSLYDEFGFPSGSGGAIHGDANLSR